MAAAKQETLPTELAIADIAAVPATNVREVDTKSDAYKELVRSVETHGVIEPLIVRLRHETSGPTHELVAGFRRLAAAKEAKLKVVPVRVFALTDSERVEFQLVENLLREDLTPMEEARAVHAYSDSTGAKPKEIAARLSKSETWVRDRLKLLNLIPRGQQLLNEGKITAQAAAIIAGYPAAVQEAVFGTDEDDLDTLLSDFAYDGVAGVRRMCENLARQVERQQAFAQKLSASKFPKCPKCGADAQREGGGGSTAVCENGHYWSLATGKLTNDYANEDGTPRRSAGPKRVSIDRAETRTLRGVTAPQEILGEWLATVKVDSIKVEAVGGDVHATFSLSGAAVPECLRTKHNTTFRLVPVEYSTGQLTQVVVDGYDGPARRKAKATVLAFLAEFDSGKAKKPESDMKAEIEKLLAGERKDVVKRLGKVKSRELLERARDAEAEGEARASVMIEMDHLLEAWRAWYGIDAK
jgi:ParB/RepB/Spo0J family partition protein